MTIERLTHNQRTMKEYHDGPEATASQIDSPALDRINKILSAPSWSVGMLEDICEIVRATGREKITSDYIAH